MKKKLLALIACTVLAALPAAPAFAADKAVDGSLSVSADGTMVLADNILYYGTVAGILRDEEGNISRLLMESERYGQYLFHVSPETVWVDDGNQTADDPSDLKEGEGLYVFRSPVQTRSLPPQSTAFAVVRNTPMDIGCAQYYEIESVAQQNGRTRIQTSNGSLFLNASEQTKVSLYGSDEEVSLHDLRPGGHIIAWTGVNATSYPAQTSALHLMLLPAASWETLTRATLAEMLYTAEGAPRISSSPSYQDVSQEAGYADAVQWMEQQDLTPWPDLDTLEPGTAVTREQLVTALWRWQGSPASCSISLDTVQDAGEISSSSRQAMAWAYQEELLSGTYLGPQNPVKIREAREMLQKLSALA